VSWGPIESNGHQGWVHPRATGRRCPCILSRVRATAPDSFGTDPRSRAVRPAATRRDLNGGGQGLLRTSVGVIFSQLGGERL
jgi:hypothetical protein